jgi:hypothetical protein
MLCREKSGNLATRGSRQEILAPTFCQPCTRERRRKGMAERPYLRKTSEILALGRTSMFEAIEISELEQVSLHYSCKKISGKNTLKKSADFHPRYGNQVF